MSARTVSWLLSCASLLLCLTAGRSLAIDSRSATLQHLGTNEGLAQGTVYKTLQDSQGFVWLATEDGLIRYDGHEVHRYASSPGRNALPGNFIFSLAEDRQTNIWVAVKGAGLAHWNRATDTFTVFRHDKSDDKTLASDFVRSVMIDSKDRLWIGTLDAGVDVFDAGTGRFAHLNHHDTDALVSDEVYSLLEDRRGEVWIGTADGIDRRVFNGHHFDRSGYQKASDTLLAGTKIVQMSDANDGTFWIASFQSGIFRLDYSGQILENLRHDANQPDSISSDEVHALLDDHAGHLWIGTADGLDSLNQSNKRIERYLHDKSDANSLSDSFIMSLYEDTTNSLWIGTRAGGVNRLNARSWEFGGNRPAWLQGKSVTAFGDAGNDHVWVGTLGAGLFNVDVRSGDAINLDSILRGSNVLGDRRIMSLHRDRHGDLWIGTLAAGLKRLTSDGHLTAIPVHADDSHAISASGIAAIYESTRGQLWIGTHGGGANIMDPVTGTIRQLPYLSTKPGSTSSANVTSFTEDPSGHIWIGTDDGGVNLADSNGVVVKTFAHDPADPATLSSNTVYAVSTDADGRVWIATDGGGLDEVIGSAEDPDHIRFSSFSVSEGLSSATLYAAVPGADGMLWLSGDAGLMRFNPSTHSVRSYHREHGLQGEEFNSGAYLRTADGRLCFGGPDGYNIFNPSQITNKSAAPRIALTSIEILGAPARESAAYWKLQTIALDYQANVVSFDFAVLDFTSPAGNRLAYRMAGLTDKWIELNSQRRITLTNLEAGDHVLEVRAANADSDWSEVPFRLSIHKKAAPWRSTVAYAAYALLLMLIIASAVQVQRQKLRQARASQRRLESEVTLRTRELQEANRQLIIAGEAKSDFLSRMGHELRTPMNGVVGMTELVARSSLTPIQTQQIQTIRASAGTLLQILNDLLDLSKAQAGKITLENLPIDLNLLMEESVATFAGAAEIKGLNLLICPLVDGGLITFGDPLRLRQVLMNLIGNAVKFTERGEIVVTGTLLTVSAGASQLEIAVTDTGIGIAAEAIASLFEPFSQADETTTRRFGGSGLGLSICQELAHLMGGDIKVDSAPLIGSTFTLAIPLKVAIKEATPPRQNPASTLVLMTRRRALRDAVSRHAVLMQMPIRYGEPSTGVQPAAGEIFVVDADSFPVEVDKVVDNRSAQLVIVGSSAVFDSLNLESRFPPAKLLRGGIERAALRRAIEAALDPNPAPVPVPLGQGAVMPQFCAHVLLVEDDEVNAAVCEGYLAALGCSSTWVTDGETAIARHKVERFDLILMDLNMPGLDGYQTSRHIRNAAQNHPRVPLIALTASNAAEHHAACLAAGMDDLLTKPYTLAECAALLRRWVDHKSVRTSVKQAMTGAHGLDRLDTALLNDLQRVCAAAPGAMFNHLVSLFEKNSTRALMELRTALAAGDFDAARALAHKLKGAASNVAAMAFSAKIGELEQACLTDTAAAGTLCDCLSAAHPPLLAELRRCRIAEPV